MNAESIRRFRFAPLLTAAVLTVLLLLLFKTTANVFLLLFLGVLISLSSSSALSNMIAGLVMTYTGAFRLGDRVKLGDAFGDVVETSLLATHVRTIKNEEIRIPVSEEKVNVSKETVVTGEVEVAKRKVTETRTVSEDLRKEDVRVDKTGGARVDDRTKNA